MDRLKTYDSTAVAPNGILYAGDLNLLQDTVAALSSYTQNLGAGSIAIGDSGLVISKYGTGEIGISAALRVTGILKGLGGIFAGTYTTTARNAISLPLYGLIILNTTTNQLEWNSGTPSVPAWISIGTLVTSGIGVLASRPSASAVASGSTYFATDQFVDYISNGSAWYRKGNPAGATQEWFSNAGIPTGWVAYDGTNLPASTGIYADLYAHLGSTLTTPDTRGRVTVGQGTHLDVDAILENDGLSVANRSPKHTSTNGLTLPDHVHPGSPGSFWKQGAGGVSYASAGGSDDFSTLGNTGDPSTHPAINGSIGPTVGATRPVDTPAFIVALKIAKL